MRKKKPENRDGFFLVMYENVHCQKCRYWSFENNDIRCMMFRQFTVSTNKINTVLHKRKLISYKEKTPSRDKSFSKAELLM